jgi:hypothetical protein
MAMRPPPAPAPRKDPSLAFAVIEPAPDRESHTIQMLPPEPPPA